VVLPRAGCVYHSLCGIFWLCVFPFFIASVRPLVAQPPPCSLLRALGAYCSSFFLFWLAFFCRSLPVVCLFFFGLLCFSPSTLFFFPIWPPPLVKIFAVRGRPVPNFGLTFFFGAPSRTGVSLLFPLFRCFHLRRPLFSFRTLIPVTASGGMVSVLKSPFFLGSTAQGQTPFFWKTPSVRHVAPFPLLLALFFLAGTPFLFLVPFSFLYLIVCFFWDLRSPRMDWRMFSPGVCAPVISVPFFPPTHGHFRRRSLTWLASGCDPATRPPPPLFIWSDGKLIL